MEERAVVLLSGGIDSTVCAAIAAEELHSSNVIPLSVVYGQKHSQEIIAAQQVSKKLCLADKPEIITIPEVIYKGNPCALLDADVEVPKTTYEDVSKAYGVSPMYVPYRNGLLLSLATAYAMRVGASVIYYGAHCEDARNWAYPDCTPEFNGAMMNAIYIGTYQEVRLVTPLQWLSKAEVVKTGLELGVPFELTYSCYSGRDKHCGQCATCVSRINAFRINKAIDPVEYEVDIAWGEYTKCIDLTKN